MASSYLDWRGDAIGLGAGEFLLELAELLIGDIIFFRGEEQAGRAGIVLELLFGFLELDANVFHLPGEPLAGLLGGLPAGFEILADELGGEGVGDGGSQDRVGGIVEDFDQAGVGLHADLEVAGHQGQDICDRRGGLGLGEMQGLAPGGEAALVSFRQPVSCRGRVWR